MKGMASPHPPLTNIGRCEPLLTCLKFCAPVSPSAFYSHRQKEGGVSKTRVAETVTAILITQVIMWLVSLGAPVLSFEVITSVTVTVALLFAVLNTIRAAIITQEQNVSYEYVKLPFQQPMVVDTPVRVFVRKNLWNMMPSLDGLMDVDLEDRTQHDLQKWALVGGVVSNVTRRDPGIQLTILRKEEETDSFPAFRFVYCGFAVTNANDALSCRKGDVVTIIGRLDSVYPTATQLAKCELVMHVPAEPSEG